MYLTPYEAPNSFLHSAENIAFLWNEHQRIVEHWVNVIPADRLHILPYEDLVQDREATIRNVIEFLELAWDAGCMEHHHNPSPITTPSQWQARQKIYKTSVGRWKNYQAWIDELTPHLRDAG
jgi:hypothetical protein